MVPPPPPPSLLAERAPDRAAEPGVPPPVDRRSPGAAGLVDPVALDPLAGELLDPLAAARRALTRAAEDDLGSLPDAVLADRIDALTTLVERAEGLLVRTIAAWDGRLAWLADGAAAPVPWLTGHTGTAADAGRRRVRCGRLLGEHAAIEQALAAGELTADHVAVLARVATRERRRLFARDLHVLLDAARLLDVDTFRDAALRWAAYADDELDRPPRSLRDDLDRRRLHLRPLTNGMVALDGLLPAAAAAVVQAALDHLDRPDPAHCPDGPRSRAQRAADHLVELARRAMARPDGSHDPEATLLVHIDADVYEGTDDPARAATRPHAACGLADGTPLPPESIRRFGCASWVSAVLFSAEHDVLHLGRRRRLFSAAQRRALIARDRGCVFPGCDRPASWCRTHHLAPWGGPAEGPTDIDNGCLLCDRHHTLVHEGGWQIRHEPDGGWTVFDHLGRPRAATDAERRRREPPRGRLPAGRGTSRRPLGRLRS